MQDLISRSAVLRLVDETKRMPIFSADQQPSEIKQAECRGAKHLRAALMMKIADPSVIESEDGRVYDVAKFDSHYRLIPCDEDVTCGACGYKRPRLRGEEIFFCSVCGACIGGLKEDFQ